MANKKISELPAATTPLDNADLFEVVQGGVNKKVAKSDVSTGGGGSGTVNSGTQYRLAHYAATGTTVSETAAITAARVLISDANGLPTHSTVTETTLVYLDATSSIQTQLNALNTASVGAKLYMYNNFT